jgi:hypothetical protein
MATRAYGSSIQAAPTVESDDDADVRGAGWLVLVVRREEAAARRVVSPGPGGADMCRCRRPESMKQEF